MSISSHCFWHKEGGKGLLPTIISASMTQSERVIPSQGFGTGVVESLGGVVVSWAEAESRELKRILFMFTQLNIILKKIH